MPLLNKLASNWTDAGFRRRFLRMALAGAMVAVVLGPITKVASDHYRIAIDEQERHCLPWSVFFLALGPVSTPQRGEIVSASVPGTLVRQKDARVLLTKMVGGVAGDVLEVRDGQAFLNGKKFGDMDLVARMGKPEGFYDRKEVIPQGKVLLIGTMPRSFDGRYWGFTDVHQVIGKATPLF